MKTKDENKVVRITVRVDPFMAEMLAVRARRWKTTKSDVIRHALNHILAAERELRSRLTDERSR